jgi:hypothetical protein
MTTYVDDIRFVLSEVGRIAKMDPREVLKLPFEESLAMLPHPSGRGKMVCGAAAYRRLQNLADRALARSLYAGRIEATAVFKQLSSLIVQRFVCEGRELDESQAARVVNAAIKASAAACRDLTHFLPCHLGHEKSPESFSIGPVKFYQ